MTEARSNPPEDRPHRGAVVGAVLCGGASSRFGSDKALAPFGGSTVGARVVDALRQGGADPVVAIGGTVGSQLAVPTVADRRPGLGPLGGLATALLWARHGWVVVVPCDLPLLGADAVAALLEARSPDTPTSPSASGRSTDGRPDEDLPAPVVATIGGRPRVSLGCWPAGHGPRLLRLVDGGTLAFRAALDGIDWIGVEVGPTNLEDVDTVEQLDRLAAMPDTDSSPGESPEGTSR